MDPLVVFVDLLPLLAPNGEDIVLQGEPDVFRIYAGELHGDLERVLVFGNIGRGKQSRGDYAALQPAGFLGRGGAGGAAG